jgi:hypothetical protein
MHGVRKAEGGGLQGAPKGKAAKRLKGGDQEVQGRLESDPVHVHVLRPEVNVLSRSVVCRVVCDSDDDDDNDDENDGRSLP